MGNYVDSADVIAEGVPSGTPAALITRRIAKWEAIVEQITGNVFRVLTPGELRFDGNDSDILHFNLPLIAVTSMRINEETVALPTTDYVVFNGRAKPNDDRPNPKIRLRPARTSIFRTSSSLFINGLDQFVTATWGYVEEDGTSTPQPIKDAILRLVAMDLDGYFDVAGGLIGGPVSQKRREKTDGHEIEYFQVENPRVVWQSIPADVADILAMYRRPWKIAVPSPPRHLETIALGISIFSS